METLWQGMENKIGLFLNCCISKGYIVYNHGVEDGQFEFSVEDGQFLDLGLEMDNFWVWG